MKKQGPDVFWLYVVLADLWLHCAAWAEPAAPVRPKASITNPGPSAYSFNLRMGHAAQLVRAHKSAEALNNVLGILKDYPDNSRALAQAGELESGRDMYEEGAKHLRRCLELDLNCREKAVFIRLANDYVALGNAQESVRVFDHAIKNLPGQAELYCERGALRSNLNDEAMALADLNKAVSLAPHNEHYLYIRGSIYLQMKRDREAVADFTKVIKLGPSNTKVYVRRAKAYQRLGLAELAKKDLDTVNQFGEDALGN